MDSHFSKNRLKNEGISQGFLRFFRRGHHVQARGNVEATSSALI
jgi:hypothetical protein